MCQLADASVYRDAGVSVTILVWYFLATIVLDHAHLVSPVCVAWSSASYRRHMLESPTQFILVPSLALAIPIAIGLSYHRADWPVRAVVAVYIVWNAYHFGAQHFGVASLLGWRKSRRWFRQAVTIIPTMAVMLVPFAYSSPWLYILGAVISLAHWLTDIGLSGWRVQRWWLFLAAVLALGSVGFLWKAVVPCSQLVCTVAYSAPILICSRCGLGFVHFLYSHWVWKISDPQVRATIGRWHEVRVLS